LRVVRSALIIKTMKKEIEINEQDLKDLKAVRNYFGQHDKTIFEHKAYAVLDKFYKKLTEIKK
jgi:hypothetical protein